MGDSRWLGWAPVGRRGSSGEGAGIVARKRVTHVSFAGYYVGRGGKTNWRWVLMRAAVVMLAWVIVAIVGLLPWRAGLWWWIVIPLGLWLW